jgi:hypothetical protein
MKVNPLKDKSYQFAIRIVLSQFLQQEKKEFVLSKLLLRSENAKIDFQPQFFILNF